MINGYEIRKVYNEEILYLDISFDTEFAKLNAKNKKIKLDEIVSDFIQKNNIKFKGITVALLAGGMVMGYVILNDNLKYAVNNLDKYTTTIVQKTNDELLRKNVSDNINLESEIKDKKEETLNVQNVTNNTIKDNKNTNIKTNTNNRKVEVKTKKDNNNYITIKRSSRLITNIEVEEYVIGVVGAEMPASFNE